ncbi:MAG: hypothetical protein WAU10_18355, partial [Caldilineaceae bacterium]
DHCITLRTGVQSSLAGNSRRARNLIITQHLFAVTSLFSASRAISRVAFFYESQKFLQRDSQHEDSLSTSAE